MHERSAKTLFSFLILGLWLFLHPYSWAKPPYVRCTLKALEAKRKGESILSLILKNRKNQPSGLAQLDTELKGYFYLGKLITESRLHPEIKIDWKVYINNSGEVVIHNDQTGLLKGKLNADGKLILPFKPIFAQDASLEGEAQAIEINRKYTSRNQYRLNIFNWRKDVGFNSMGEIEGFRFFLIQLISESSY